MQKPLRLGLSTSSFIYVMPEELVREAYVDMSNEPARKFDDRLNLKMMDFMRSVMRVANSMAIDALECYHSPSYDTARICEIALDQPNVEFWSLHAPYGRSLDPSSPEDHTRQQAETVLKDTVDAAKHIGAKTVVCHPGSGEAWPVPRKDRLKNAAEVFRLIAPYAADRGVRIAVEPLSGDQPGNTLGEILFILETVNQPNVGMNFDVNHLYPPNKIPSMVREAGSRVFSVHISDQDGQERHWLPFMGTMPWREVLEALLAIGYDGPLIYETHIKHVRSVEAVGELVVENYQELMGLLKS